MSTSKTEIRTALVGMKEALYRRLCYKDDETTDTAAAVLAETLVEEAHRWGPEYMSAPAAYGDIEAGRVAMTALDEAFWGDKDKGERLEGPFPKTRAVLIEAVFAGWAASSPSPYDKRVPEVVFARYISRAMQGWSKKERDAARPKLQEILRLLHEMQAAEAPDKVARLLIASEITDDHEILREMGRNLSHYTSHDRLTLMAQAHLSEVPDGRPPRALSIALPEIILGGENATRLAEIGMRVVAHLGGTTPYRPNVKCGEIRLIRTLYVDSEGPLSADEEMGHQTQVNEDQQHIIEWWGHVDMKTRELLFLRYEVRSVRGNKELFLRTQGLVLKAN